MTSIVNTTDQELGVELQHLPVMNRAHTPLDWTDLQNDQFALEWNYVSSRPPSSFDHAQLVPQGTVLKEMPSMPVVAFGPVSDGRLSAPSGTHSPVSALEDPLDSMVEHGSDSDAPPLDSATSYDLKAPLPHGIHTDLDDLVPHFFSPDHLDVIVHDHRFLRTFSSFLQHHRPHLSIALSEYVNLQKAVAAVSYANAVAERIALDDSDRHAGAASIHEAFNKRVHRAANQLTEEALHPFLTTQLAHIVTDTLVKEITGQGTPLLRDMIPSLAEVFCLSDPSLPDNPIVYASEGFYSTSQYDKEYSIGRNCRFLQGPKTSRSSVKRLAEALAEGQEVTEAILNYRRDGTPFLNLLLIAPLYDNNGAVRYFLGAQIDVSSLIQGGKGFESFEQLLHKHRVDSPLGHRSNKNSTEVLSELGGMLSVEEINAMKQIAMRASGGPDRASTVSRSTWYGRKLLGMDEDDAGADKGFWPHQSFGHSGRLPGVYQNYLLVRPYPSLRITFTSPALRIPGLLQSKLLDRIEGPSNVREGIEEALSEGTSVTAKVNWYTQPSRGEDSEVRQRWLHCTPLMGSDDKVGVWMVVIVEKEEVTGRLNNFTPEAHHRSVSLRPATAQSDREASEKMYQDHLRQQSRGHRSTPSGSSAWK